MSDEEKKENKENQKSEAALREEKVLEFWRENQIFEKSLDKEAPNGEFVFYEGPPTANAKPALHHLAARAFKDIIPRYKSMRGYHVRRKGGWDTHGLPVELQVEKKLGLNSKKAIEEYGIEKFNQECKASVWEHIGEWTKFTERIGYWVDQKNPYVTYDNNYIESVWNILKNVDDQGLLYKDYKVVPWCPRCGTALSSHELAQGYETVKDLSVYAKFKIVGVENGYFLAWTTTPWTLPGNVALAVGEDIDYVEAKVNGEILVLAKERLSIITEPYEIVAEHKGKEMIGMEYEPLYPFLKDNVHETEKGKLVKAFKVYGADFVTTTDGTGIVHTAVMYGQDDFVLGTEVGLPKHHLVGLDGKFLAGTGIFEGRFVRDEEVAVDVIKDLAHRGLLFKKEKYEHSYPHCWRCKTALIYYARDSWYIRMSNPKIKGEMIAQNKEINWEPAHIRDGRFGEWLKEIKDWAISRERYWGTPLPIWMSQDGEKLVVDSFETLKKYTKKSGNTYFMMRHGEAGHNLTETISNDPLELNHLTEKGREQVKATAETLKGEKIDIIISSPYVRTRETSEIMREALGLSSEQVLFDEKIGELLVGDLGSNKWVDYMKLMPKELSTFDKKLKNGESMQDIKNRMTSFVYELEEKYKGKNILIVSHGAPTWLLYAGVQGYTPAQALEFIKGTKVFSFLQPAGFLKLDFVSLPHNENYELDPHRPFIDGIVLEKDGKEFKRTKEVLDVWFDSGSMPFAQDHYPFENKEWVDDKGFPADYISEAIDQTRGWFYTMHAIGVLMGRGKAYKNVICLGHLLDAKGKKMSKSIGNIVDPWTMIEKYGVDALRLWMYSVNQPGESKNFDEKTVLELHRQVFGLLYNVLAFYELYRDKDLEKTEETKSENILDQWIIARLNELLKLSTENLDNFKLLEPTRAIRDFIGDLSTWYLRRSRERIKDGDKEAKATLYFVLKTLAKLMAPLAPFSAEDIWLKLKNSRASADGARHDFAKSDAASVHLAEWPSVSAAEHSDIIENMRITREIVSLGLEARQKAGIRVRQPLGELKIKGHELRKEYEEIVQDELNVKKIVSAKGEETITVDFDATITPELKAEGDYREFVRAVQDLRKKIGLTPSDVITLTIETNDAGKELLQKFESDLKKVVLASKIEFKENGGEEVKVDELVFKVKIEK